MVYTNQAFENKEFEFPPPPLWLTWIANYDYSTHGIGKEGTIRHQETLAKAKRYVGAYANDGFYSDWSIYEWTGSQYELRFSGRKGQKKRDHVLWTKLKDVKPGKLAGRDATDEELEEVMASILASANG